MPHRVSGGSIGDICAFIFLILWIVNLSELGCFVNVKQHLDREKSMFLAAVWHFSLSDELGEPELQGISQIGFWNMRISEEGVVHPLVSGILQVDPS